MDDGAELAGAAEETPSDGDFDAEQHLVDGIEVFDAGNPDGKANDLAAVNQVLLRVEVAIGRGFLGGSGNLRAIVPSTQTRARGETTN